MNTLKALGIIAQGLIPWIVLGTLIFLISRYKKRGDSQKARNLTIVLLILVGGGIVVGIFIIFALSQWARKSWTTY